MRRWNGWGDDSIEEHVPHRAMTLLRELVGPSSRPGRRDARRRGRRRPARPRLDADPGLALDAGPARAGPARPRAEPAGLDRAAHPAVSARCPDAVARPADSAAVAALLAAAGTHGCDARSRTAAGAASSAASTSSAVRSAGGDRRPGRHRRASITLDETSGLATFGAGTLGPGGRGRPGAVRPDPRPLPAVVRGAPRVGGWVVTRSVGQQAHGFGRIDELFAGGHARDAAAAPLDLPPHPASAAGPDLRQLVLGSEGRLGILTEVTVRASRTPRARAVQRRTSCPTGTGRSSSPGASASRACRCRWPASRRRSRRPPRSPSPATDEAAASCAATSAGAARDPSAAS